MELIKGTFIVIVIIISFISILLVLMQSSKGGGGLFGDTGGSQSVIGSDRRGDFFSKLTSIFLAIFMGGSLLIAYLEHEANAGIKAPPEASSVEEEENIIEDTKTEENDIDIKIDKSPINTKTEDKKEDKKENINTKTKAIKTKNKSTTATEKNTQNKKEINKETSKEKK